MISSIIIVLSALFILPVIIVGMLIHYTVKSSETKADISRADKYWKYPNEDD